MGWDFVRSIILRISPAFGLFRGCCGESETVCTGNGEDIRNAWAIIHDFDIKATLCAMHAYVIFAENGGGEYDFMQITSDFPLTATLLL